MHPPPRLFGELAYQAREVRE